MLLVVLQRTLTSIEQPRDLLVATRPDGFTSWGPHCRTKGRSSFGGVPFRVKFGVPQIVPGANRSATPGIGCRAGRVCCEVITISLIFAITIGSGVSVGTPISRDGNVFCRGVGRVPGRRRSTQVSRPQYPDGEKERKQGATIKSVGPSRDNIVRCVLAQQEALMLLASHCTTS